VDTGLTYANARYYSGTMGRWLSQDPIFQEIMDEKTVSTKSEMPYYEYLSNPQGLNSYSYVINNPLKYNDFTGESYTQGIGGWFVGVAQHFGNTIRSALNAQAHPIATAVNTFSSTINKADAAMRVASDLKADPKATINRIEKNAQTKFNEFLDKPDYAKGKIVGDITGAAMEAVVAKKVSEGAISGNMRQTLLGAEEGVQIGKYNLGIDGYNRGGGGMNLRDTSLSNTRTQQRIFGVDYHNNPYGPKLHFHLGTGDTGKIHRPWQRP